MDIIREKEKFLPFIIPSSGGRKHVHILPHVCRGGKGSKILFRLIYQSICLDEYRVGKHIHIVSKCEFLHFGLIHTATALYDLTVLIPHGTSMHKHSYRVLRIIIQMPGPQRVMILVSQLYGRAPELRQIHIDKICKLVTGKNRLILKYADIAPCVNDLRLHIPICSIAQKVGVIMKKTGRTDNLPVAGSIHIHKLSRL